MTTTTFPTFRRSTRLLHSLFLLNQLAIQHLFRQLSSYWSSSAAPHRDKWPFTDGSCTDKLVGALAALYVNYEHVATYTVKIPARQCHHYSPLPLFVLPKGAEWDKNRPWYPELVQDVEGALAKLWSCRTRTWSSHHRRSHSGDGGQSVHPYPSPPIHLCAELCHTGWQQQRTKGHTM